MWDVFICHASEDKDAIARPLAEALQKRGLRVWYDDFTLKLGDSLRRTIDLGLKESTYGIVILSKSFFYKDWPQKELDGLNERERNGNKVILPIWHDLTKEEVESYSPMLAGRVAAKTKDGMRHTVDMVMDVFGQSAPPTPPDYIITDKIVRIETNKDSFIIGSSVSFSGFSINCGDHVYLTIFGPGEYSKGKEVANLPVSNSNTWEYTWSPGSSIHPGHYSVTVFDSDKKITDEVTVIAEKGAVSILASGDGSYYLGERINLVGTCTAGKKVYLTIKGPDASRQERKLDQLEVLSKNGDADSFFSVDVRQNFTWSYMWDTKKVAAQLEEGFYTIYAIESPVSSDNLIGKSYGTVTIMMRPPFISATMSHSQYAQGNPIRISGTAEGIRYHEILIWIFGEKDTIVDKITVNPDASYLYQIPGIITKKLEVGQYFAIIQHPMLDDKFGVYFDNDKQKVLSSIPKEGTELFSLKGEGSYNGFKAISALITAINDPRMDDTYTKLSFIIETPTIRFDTIDDKKVGDKFSIVASTNLAVDNEIFMECYISSQDTDPENHHKKTNAMKGIVRVTKGEAGWNKISIDVDSTQLTPGYYILKASARDLDLDVSTSFKIE